MTFLRKVREMDFCRLSDLYFVVYWAFPTNLQCTYIVFKVFINVTQQTVTRQLRIVCTCWNADAKKGYIFLKFVQLTHTISQKNVQMNGGMIVISN